MITDTLTLLAAAASGAVLGVAFSFGMLASPTYAPPLAGFGCDGASDVLFAYHESDFPQCAAIERVQ